MAHGEWARIPVTAVRRIHRTRFSGLRNVGKLVVSGFGRRIRADRERGPAGGAVPAGTTVFSGDVPAVGNLDPALLAALRRAALAAAADGVEFVVNGGWRAPEYQARLRREAVSRYGSEREAARWVATPGTSPHVRGAAVDVGPAAARAWLARHGARYGLCQIYRNEPWHYELRPAAVHHGPPPQYPDPSQDPRLSVTGEDGRVV